jgi:hypothetical protein
MHQDDENIIIKFKLMYNVHFFDVFLVYAFNSSTWVVTADFRMGNYLHCAEKRKMHLKLNNG